jgi:hypothetical protein
MTMGKGTRYWIVIQMPILAAAAVLGLAGGHGWALISRTQDFRPSDLILPSCLTWLFLAPLLADSTSRRATVIGLISLLLGSAIVILAGLGPMKQMSFSGVAGFLAAMLYALIHIKSTFWVTIPVAIGSGHVMRAIFRRWPPPEEARFQPGFSWLYPSTQRGRYLLALIPFLPLLALPIPLGRDLHGPAVQLPPSLLYVHVLAPIGMLAQLYFFPVALITTISGFGRLIFYHKLLCVIYAAIVSALLYCESNRGSA